MNLARNIIGLLGFFLFVFSIANIYLPAAGIVAGILMMIASEPEK